MPEQRELQEHGTYSLSEITEQGFQQQPGTRSWQPGLEVYTRSVQRDDNNFDVTTLHIRRKTWESEYEIMSISESVSTKPKENERKSS